MECAVYQDHNIRVCSYNYSNANDYLNILDSLQREYPYESPQDTVLKSISIGEGHRVTQAEWNQMNQFDSQGYVCNCVTPD
jgi:predicted N-acyltransferase